MSSNSSAPNQKMNSIFQPIVSIGDLVADLIVAIPTLPAEAGRHQIAEEIQLEPGGGANFLIAGARLGYPMAAVGALGDDLWGDQVAGLIRREGVDISGVQRDGTTTRVVVLVSQAGEHLFLGKYGQGRKITLRPGDMALIKSCGALYCAGYSLAEARLADLTLEGMVLAHRHHRPIFFDPGPQIAAVTPDLRQKVLSLTDTLLLTAEEVPLLTAGSAGSISDLMAQDGGPGTVVVKRGPAGCRIYRAGVEASPFDLPGYPVTVADSSAAGDSFNAAFMVAILWGWPPADCAKLANAVGAAKVRKLGGGRNVPTLAEVRSIITEFEIDIEI
jgi:sugar/nucleoside kinase (ribokinase family)